MPQMSPMNWMLIFLLFMVMFMLTMNSISFFKATNMNKKTVTQKESPMKW